MQRGKVTLSKTALTLLSPSKTFTSIRLKVVLKIIYLMKEQQGE